MNLFHILSFMKHFPQSKWEYDELYQFIGIPSLFYRTKSIMCNLVYFVFHRKTILRIRISKFNEDETFYFE